MDETRPKEKKKKKKEERKRKTLHFFHVIAEIFCIRIMDIYIA